MDPAATIAALLAGRMTKADARDAVASWYARKGYRPALAHIEALAQIQQTRLPRNWKALARSLGATDT